MPVEEPQVQEAGIPGAPTSGDLPLAAAGGGDEANKAQSEVIQTADSATKVFLDRAEKGRQMAIDSEIYGAAAQLSQAQTELMNQARSQKGQNAFGIYNPTMDAFKEKAFQIGQNLRTPEARASYARLAFSHQAELDRGLQDHIYTQRQEDTKQTIAAASDQFENAAIQASLIDPQAMKSNLGYARASDGALARNAGLSPVATQAFLEQRQSGRQLKILNSYISAGQDLTAEAYFKDNADEFKGEDRIKAQQLVMEGTAQGQALRAVDKIFAPSFGMVAQGEGPAIIPGAQTLGAAMEKAQEIKDDKVRKYAQQEVSRRWTQMEQDREQQQKATFQDLAKQAALSGDINQVMRSNPEAFFNGITAQQRTELFAQAKMFAENRDPVTDTVIWYEQYRNATNPNTAAKFVDQDLIQLRSKLSAEHFKQLVDLQGDLKSKSGNAAAPMAFARLVEDTLLKESVFSTTFGMMSNTDKRRFAAFNLEATSKLEAFKRDVLKGVGAPTEAQMQDIVDKMIRNKAPSSGWFYNSKMPAAAVLPEDRVLTSEARDDMTALIKANGKIVTEEKLQRMNEAFQNGNDKLYLKISNE